MSKEVLKKKIGETTYTITQFGVKKSLRILTKLGRVIGGPLAESGGSVKNLTEDNIFKLLSSLTNKLGDDELFDLLEEVCSCVVASPGGKLSDTFETHFHGNLLGPFKVATAAIQHNYKDFLADVLAQTGLENLGIKSDPQTSTGTLGGPSSQEKQHLESLKAGGQ